MRSEWVVAAVAALTIVTFSEANAAPVFSDNFNSYSPSLNWVPPANWAVTSGSVDLIGANSGFDFFPGNGGYVDLDGSTGSPGTLQTISSFAPGNYTLTFDLGGNARNDGSKTTVITLGSFATSITLASADPYQLFSFNFLTTGGQLSFADFAGGNNNIGNILDNVSLSTAAVPESSTWAMMILGLFSVGFVAYRKRRETPKLRLV
jgi:hypothetical protein